MKFSLWTPEYFIANQENCLEILKDESEWRKIPFLNHANLSELRDTSLVRFRGMVQDMFNPEIYLEEYEVQNDNDRTTRMQNGKFRDILFVQKHESVEQDSRKNKFGDRKSYFIVSVPGLNSWAVAEEKLLPSKYEQTVREDVRADKAPKRPCDSDSMEVDLQEMPNKKVNSEAEQPVPVLSAEYVVNSPLPSRPSRACMIKTYSDSEDFGLGTVLDIVGFLSVDPSLDGSTRETEEDQFETAEEIQALHPPPSLVPRLHAISVRRPDHINPIKDLRVEAPAEIFKELKSILTQCLLEDDIAAEYLLYHLISSIYVRTELAPLGQFTLNITNIPAALPKYTEQLYSIIELLVPASYYFSATLENLNTLQFFPKEDAHTNKLISGLLQLAPHTHFIVDETQMQPGKLNEAGLNAVQHLSHVIEFQKIKCIFKFFSTEYECNIPILILSEAKSFLPKNFQIPLKYDKASIELAMEALPAAHHFLQAHLGAIRRYLTAMRVQTYEMGSEVSELIQEDFVRMRREKNATMDDLHNLMVISRLCGLARGKKTLDEEAWQRAVFLEEERISRLKTVAPKM